MPYPIVKVITPDNIQLFGLLSEPELSTKTILINIHGTASAFYVEEFEQQFVETLTSNRISTLFTNNRGNYVMESWQSTGAALEKFEDCLIDIDTWIEFAQNKGYERIILQGHSLGSEKVVYYMEKGKYKDKVRAVILLGFCDSYGYHEQYLKTINIDPSIEAQKLVNEGMGYQFITNPWKSHAGALPQSAASYLNFFSNNSELSKTLPLRLGRDLKYYQHIRVPILGIISTGKEYTIIPTEQAAALLKSENPLSEAYILKDTDHCFVGKQSEVAKMVYNFIKCKL